MAFPAAPWFSTTTSRDYRWQSRSKASPSRHRSCPARRAGRGLRAPAHRSRRRDESTTLDHPTRRCGVGSAARRAADTSEAAPPPRDRRGLLASLLTVGARKGRSGAISNPIEPERVETRIQVGEGQESQIRGVFLGKQRGLKSWRARHPPSFGFRCLPVVSHERPRNFL